MKDTTEAAEPAKKTATGGGEKLLYRVVKAPEGKRCLRVRLGKNGWRWYPGHKPELTREQFEQLEKDHPGCLEPITQL